MYDAIPRKWAFSWQHGKTHNPVRSDFVVSYFEEQWLRKNYMRFEGAVVGHPSTNNGIEAMNGTLKREYTMRDRFNSWIYWLIISKSGPKWEILLQKIVSSSSAAKEAYIEENTGWLQSKQWNMEDVQQIYANYRPFNNFLFSSAFYISRSMYSYTVHEILQTV